MIPSTDAYNLGFAGVNGVFLHGVAVFFRQSGPIHSAYPGCTFHFEFWRNPAGLYACIHTQHDMYLSINLRNLITQIDAYSPLIIHNINAHIHLPHPVINTPHLVGGIGHTSTFTFNVQCNFTPHINAAIMNDIVHFISAHPL